jgi:hypothetical protein
MVGKRNSMYTLRAEDTAAIFSGKEIGKLSFHQNWFEKTTVAPRSQKYYELTSAFKT